MIFLVSVTSVYHHQKLGTPTTPFPSEKMIATPLFNEAGIQGQPTDCEGMRKVTGSTSQQCDECRKGCDEICRIPGPAHLPALTFYTDDSFSVFSGFEEQYEFFLTRFLPRMEWAARFSSLTTIERVDF